MKGLPLSRSKRASAVRRTRRPMLETLEGRQLLARVVWTAEVDGFWDVGSNWDNGVGPADGDDVVIRADANITVTYRGLGANSIASLTNNETLVIQSGHTFRWTSGTWQGTGRTVVENGATLEFAEDSKSFQRYEINNRGTIVWSGGDIELRTGQVLIFNDTNGVFDVQSDSDMTRTNGRLIFENRGLLTKTDGVEESILVPPSSNFNTTGRVVLASGTLVFDSSYQQLGFPTTVTSFEGGNLRLGAGGVLGAGAFVGSGTIFGDLANTNGILSPGGNQIGTITIVGTYNQSEFGLGTLLMQVQGTTPGVDIDQLVIQQTPELTGGIARLGGVLQAEVTGLTPVLGNRFPLIQGATLGKFTSTVLPPLVDPNTFWIVDYEADNVAIQVVSTTANLTLTKTATSSSVAVGQVLVYRIQVTNLGPNSTDNVIVSDTLPVGVEFVPEESTQAVEFDPVTRRASVNLRFFTVGEQATVRIAVRPTAAVGGTVIVNQASVTSDEPDPDRTNNRASVSTPVQGAAQLLLTKNGPAQIGVGQPFVYTITVLNNGPNAATNLNVFEELPPNVIYRSDLSSPGLLVSAAAGAVIAQVGNLPVGQSATFTIAFEPTVATSGTQVTSRAFALSNEEIGDVPRATLTTSVIPAPEVLRLTRGRVGQRPALFVQFTTAMDPATAENLANYDLRLAGRDRRFGTGDDRVIRITRATYDAGRNRVVLILARGLGGTQKQFVASAAVNGLTSAQQIRLAGNGSGYPGFDFVRRFVNLPGGQSTQGLAHQTRKRG